MTTSVIPTRVAEILELFPGATWGTQGSRHLPVSTTFVRLVLQPLAPDAILEVARALNARKALRVSADGTLTAAMSAPALSRDLERRLQRITPQRFTVEIRWLSNRKHPLVFVLDPVINSQTHPPNLHLLPTLHPDVFAHAICVYGPHEVKWNPVTDSQYHLVLWISAWLACKQFHQATGQWLGPEASHSLVTISRKFKNAECHCGSGRPMKQCHPPDRQIAALRYRRPHP